MTWWPLLRKFCQRVHQGVEHQVGRFLKVLPLLLLMPSEWIRMMVSMLVLIVIDSRWDICSAQYSLRLDPKLNIDLRTHT